MPKDAKILSVQKQEEELVLWAEVNTTAEVENRNINIFETGHSIPEELDLVYLGTVLFMNDSFVAHVFEQKMEKKDYVCGDCGHEQSSMSKPCENCGSVKVVLISIIEQELGPNWRELCFDMNTTKP